jgi:hypothetical protein
MHETRKYTMRVKSIWTEYQNEISQCSSYIALYAHFVSCWNYHRSSLHEKRSLTSGRVPVSSRNFRASFPDDPCYMHFYFFVYLIYQYVRENTVIARNICHEICNGLHMLNPLNTKRFFVYRLYISVHIHIWMSASLAPKLIDGFCSFSVLKSLFILERCPVNMNIPAPKIRALKWIPQHNKAIFSKMTMMILIKYKCFR